MATLWEPENKPQFIFWLSGLPFAVKSCNSSCLIVDDVPAVVLMCYEECVGNTCRKLQNLCNNPVALAAISKGVQALKLL